MDGRDHIMNEIYHLVSSHDVSYKDKPSVTFNEIPSCKAKLNEDGARDKLEE